MSPADDGGEQLVIAGVPAGPGSRARGVLEVAVPGAESLALPLTLVRGATPGPLLVVVAGLHGAEYASIEAAWRFAGTLDPAGLRGAVVVLPVVNLPAFVTRVAYVNPLDGKNLNRVFPGRADGSASEILADVLMREVVAHADALVDLHGGDLVEALTPFTLYVRTGRPDVDTRARAIAHAFPVGHVVANPAGAPTATGLLYAEAAARRVPAVIAEAGGQGVTREADVAVHLAGLVGTLEVLGMGGPVRSPGGRARAAAREWTGFAWLRAPQAGRLVLGVAVGETVRAQQAVGEIHDLHGGAVATLLAPASGPVLFLVTSLAINRDDPVLGVATG